MVARMRGFTIVEVLIVLIAISVLVAIVASRFVSGQAQARDVDRRADIDTIARRLEIVYTNRLLGVASYPRTTDITEGSTALQELDREALRTTLVANSQPMSLVAATNSTATTAGILPQPTINQYVYQPLTSADTLCNATLVCVKFNLYYRQEISGTIMKVASQRQ